MNIEQTLENIGLTKNEIKIYLALLDLGLTSSGAIIKKTGIHTSKVYDGLERLSEKGLTSHIIKSNTKYFKAVNPDRLIDFIRDKKKKLEELNGKKQKRRHTILGLKEKLLNKLRQ